MALVVHQHTFLNRLLTPQLTALACLDLTFACMPLNGMIKLACITN